MNIRHVYLALAVIGAVVPYIFFIEHFSTTGFSPGHFIALLFANSPAAGFTADLMISSPVFWVAMFHQRRRGKGPNPALLVALNLTIGLSCAMPAYLYATAERQ